MLQNIHFFTLKNQIIAIFAKFYFKKHNKSKTE